MWKLMQFLGFGDDDYDDDDYEEEPRAPRKPAPAKQRQHGEGSSPRLVMFKGVPSEDMKLKLRKAFRDGTMILLDFHELSQREFEEEGQPFITFMGGVAFASGGHMEFLEPAQYLVMPHEGMFKQLTEEDPNDGTFDRQRR